MCSHKILTTIVFFICLIFSESFSSSKDLQKTKQGKSNVLKIVKKIEKNGKDNEQKPSEEKNNNNIDSPKSFVETVWEKLMKTNDNSEVQKIFTQHFDMQKINAKIFGTITKENSKIFAEFLSLMFLSDLKNLCKDATDMSDSMKNKDGNHIVKRQIQGMEVTWTVTKKGTKFAISDFTIKGFSVFGEIKKKVADLLEKIKADKRIQLSKAKGVENKNPKKLMDPATEKLISQEAIKELFAIMELENEGMKKKIKQIDAMKSAKKKKNN